MPPPEFVAYIDESGDDGLHKFHTPEAGGSTHWLVLGCCMVRKVNDLSLVAHRDSILTHIKRTKKRDIHFTHLNHSQKVVVVNHMAHMPIRLSHILCCKKHIPNPAIYNNKAQLYWYLCRTLIERISWFCSANAKTQWPTAEIVFSNRGGLKYEDFRNYLEILRFGETKIKWNVISPEAVRSESAERLAGLQFADSAASSFFAAVEPNLYGNYDHGYALALKPVVYHRKRNFLSYGVKQRCDLAALDDRQREFFSHFEKK